MGIFPFTEIVAHTTAFHCPSFRAYHVRTRPTQMFNVRVNIINSIALAAKVVTMKNVMKRRTAEETTEKNGRLSLSELS